MLQRHRQLSNHEQVITLWVATHKVMLDVELKKVKEFQMDMLAYFDKNYPEIGKQIEEKKVLDEELGNKILEVAEEFKNKSR